MAKKLKPEFELAKKLPGHSQMERVMAARCFINQASRAPQDKIEDLELHAFMSIFHPEVPVATVREMSRDRRGRR